MLRLVMQLTNVAVQAATHAGEEEPQMDVPKDPQARGAKIGGRVGEILVDLGESGSDDLIAQGKVGESECQDQDCGGAGEGNARPIEHEQVTDTEKHAGHGGREHAQKIDGASTGIARWSTRKAATVEKKVAASAGRSSK